ncbi:hypothetical protein [Pseudomonas sp. LAM2023]|uniref:hypothetical protein n=1 Tax=Pseudomonas sp. LAM2023 TaxID=2800477 RepID=UPI00190C70B5|nr:hypothetical protein [Pseudomonas sp. LAM2023]
MSEPPISSDEPPVIPSELKQLHDAMTTTLQAELPQFRLIEAYPKLVKEGMKLPALLYAATNFAPGADPGDGRLCLKVTFEALVLLESSRALAPLQAAILASKLMKVLRLQYWEADFVGPTENVQAMPAEFVPELASCVGWSVQWQQDVYLGDVEWPWEDQPPGSLVFAFEPDSGPGSEGQYQAPEAMA